MASGVSITELKIMFGAEIQPLLAALEAAKSGMKNFQKEADQIVERTRTPQERYLANLEQLEKIRDAQPDVINYDTYLREKERLYVQMRKETAATEEGIRAAKEKADAERQVQSLQRAAAGYIERTKTAYERYRDEIDRVNAASKAANWTDQQRMKVLDMLQAEYQQTQAAANAAAMAQGKGSQKLGMGIGELARGAEDFLTVFGTMGVAGGMRAAANNMSQAAYVMAGPLMGGIVGVGTALGTVLLPKLYDYITGAKSAAATSKAWAKELDSLTRIFTYANDMEAIQIKTDIAVRDIGKITHEDQINERIESLSDDLRTAKNEASRAEGELKAISERISREIFTDQVDADFSDLFNFLGRELGSETENFFKDDLATIKAKFAGNLGIIPVEDALKQFERDIDLLTESMEIIIRKNNLGPALNEMLKGSYSDVLGMGGAFLDDTALGKLYTKLDDPAVLDNIQALLANETELEKLAKDAGMSKEEYRKQMQDIELISTQLVALEEQRTKAIELRREAERQAAQEKFDELKQDYERLTLLNGMTEEERKQYDLDQKRIALREAALELGGEAANQAERIADEYERSVEAQKRLAASQKFQGSADSLVREMLALGLTDAESEKLAMEQKRLEFINQAIAAGAMELEQAQSLWAQYEAALEEAKQLEELNRRNAEHEKNREQFAQSLASMQEKALIEGMDDVDQELYRIQKERLDFLEEAAAMGGDALNAARQASDDYLRALEQNLMNDLQVQLSTNLPELREELEQFNSEAQAAQQAFNQSVAQAFNLTNQQNSAAAQRQKMLDTLAGIRQLLAGQNPVALAPIP